MASKADEPRRDWTDVLRDAADLALLGILVTVGALGVVTAAAAVATASAALHRWQESGSWPTARETLRRYVREVPRGVPVTLLAAATTALLALNAAAFAGGTVPGGPVAAGATLALGAALVGYGALTAVEIGRTEIGRTEIGRTEIGRAEIGDTEISGTPDGWRAAAKRATRAACARPVLLAALAGATVVAAALAATVVPVAVPILLGYLLAAHHAVARRLAPADGLAARAQ